MPVSYQQDQKMKDAMAYWQENPVEAIKDWFKATPDDCQAAIINDTFIGGEDRTVGKSAHGVGKTTTLAWCGWLFLNFNRSSRVVATAPTFPQLHDVLWPEYAKWQLEMPDALADQWDISGNHIRHKDRKLSKTWFAVSRTSNKPANLQGFHGTDILVECDEMSAVDAEVFEVIEGILSNAEDTGQTAKFLGMGNPNYNAGEFYHAFNKNKELYNRFTISGEPEIFSLLDMKQTNGLYHKDHGKVYLSNRVTQKYRDVIRKKYGDTGGVYDIRVRGVFPREEDNAIIPLAWAERAAIQIEEPPFDKIAHPVTIVMDVSRGGSAETVLSTFRRGHEIRKKFWAKTSTEQCVDHLADEVLYWKGKNIAVARVVVDEPGVGGGVVDTGKRRGLPISPYHGGESMKKDKDPDEDIRMFANRRARDYWNLRRAMELGNISILDDDDTVNQLSSVHFYYNDRDRITVESKLKHRERLGEDAHLDRADVIVMGTAPWYSFNSMNAFIAEEDITFGSDRPTPDIGLF